jgi:predicted enzyme related to lactoylglutathione lyase
MGDDKKPEIGSISWRDLTVSDAASVRSFYERVVGWKSSGQDMGGYEDFNMLAPESGECVAGICHARGTNADLPAQWLMYITVEDVDHSAQRCRDLGGEVVVPARPLAGGRMCVIRDPAGAVAALWQPPEG